MKTIFRRLDRGPKLRIDRKQRRQCSLWNTALSFLASLSIFLNFLRHRRDDKPTMTTSLSLLPSAQPPKAVHLLNETLHDLVIHKPVNISPSPHTVVTAYFRIPSKHSSEKYDSWMSNMLSIQDNVVVFCDPQMVNKMKQLRAHALDRTVIVELDLQHLPIAKLGGDHDHDGSSFWQHEFDMDAEASRHKSYQVFWIWLSKTYLVVHAISYNFFSSDLFMWCDIGSFRNAAFNGRTIIQHPDHVPTDTLLWMAHHTPNPPPTILWNNKLKEKQHFYQSGSQGIGSAKAWKTFHVRFAEMIDRFIEAGLFIGEDQCLLQATCSQNPHLCAYVLSSQVPDNNYRGLRFALHHDKEFDLWRPPPLPKEQ